MQKFLSWKAQWMIAAIMAVALPEIQGINNKASSSLDDNAAQSATAVAGLTATNAHAPPCANVSLAAGKVILTNVPFDLTVSLEPYMNGQAWPASMKYQVLQSDKAVATGTFESRDKFSNFVGQFQVKNLKVSGKLQDAHLQIQFDSPQQGKEPLCLSKKQAVQVMQPALSILPPLITVVIAIALKQVFVALVLGVWLGALLANSYNPLTATLRTIDTYSVNALASTNHAGIIVFTFLLGGLIGMVQKSGGALGLAKLFTRFTTTKFRGNLACFLLSLIIFFDDYSCILIVGNSMRSVVRSLGVAPAKFAFVIHAMGPAMASFSPVSSWVGVEIGYITASFDQAGVDVDPFVLFLQTIPYRFFPLMMVVCVFLVVVGQRDIGPMASSEKASCELGAIREVKESNIGDYSLDTIGKEEDSPAGEDKATVDLGPMQPSPNTPRRWYNAAIPFGLVIILTFTGMYLSGYFAIKGMDDPPKETITNIFTYANSLNALIWASLAGCVVTLILAMAQKILTLVECMDSWVAGTKDVLEPTIILILAWALGSVVADIQTGRFLAQAIGGGLPPHYLPVLTMVVAYVMSYATGTSFGAMGILFPLVVPTACQLTQDDNIRMQAVAAILGGCVFGNIASPIADTTILTSIAADCDIQEHVKTTTPYTMLVAILSLLLGPLFVGGFGLNIAVALLLCILIMALVIVGFGESGLGDVTALRRWVMARLSALLPWSNKGERPVEEDENEALLA